MSKKLLKWKSTVAVGDEVWGSTIDNGLSHTCIMPLRVLRFRETPLFGVDAEVEATGSGIKGLRWWTSVLNLDRTSAFLYNRARPDVESSVEADPMLTKCIITDQEV